MKTLNFNTFISSLSDRELMFLSLIMSDETSKNKIETYSKTNNMNIENVLVLIIENKLFLNLMKN